MRRHVRLKPPFMRMSWVAMCIHRVDDYCRKIQLDLTNNFLNLFDLEHNLTHAAVSMDNIGAIVTCNDACALLHSKLLSRSCCLCHRLKSLTLTSPNRDDASGVFLQERATRPKTSRLQATLIHNDCLA